VRGLDSWVDTLGPLLNSRRRHVGLTFSESVQLYLTRAYEPSMAAPTNARNRQVPGHSWAASVSPRARPAAPEGGEV
jgi:hypothetical protein